MSHWNYRIIRSRGERPPDSRIFYEYTVCEVYYNKDGSIYAYSDAQSPYGETFDELKGDMEYMAKALAAPILNQWEIEAVEMAAEKEWAESE